MHGCTEDLGWKGADCGDVGPRLEPPLELLWKVPCKLIDIPSNVVFAGGAVIVPDGDRALVRLDEEGVTDLTPRAQNSNFFDSSWLYCNDSESALLVNLDDGSVRRIEGWGVVGVWSRGGKTIVELPQGQIVLETGNLTEVPWRPPGGKIGRVVAGRYYGRWTAGGELVSGCLDVETGETVWLCDGLGTVRWVGKSTAIGLFPRPRLVDKQTGAIIRDLPKEWSDRSFVKEQDYAACYHGVYQFDTCEQIAAFPDSCAPITLTEGLAWIVERKGPRYDVKHDHAIVCYDLEKREEVYRKRLSKTGPSADVRYGFSDGRIFRLRNRSLECYGRA